MSTIYMDDHQGGAGHFLAPAHANPHPGGSAWDMVVDPSQTAVGRIREKAATERIRLVRADGVTARGKPPPVSVRGVMVLQWSLFAACAIRILLMSS